MAQQVNVKFVDDLDGTDAVGTVSFGLDGKTYEIDLSDDNAAKLRDSLAVFVGAAHKSGGSAATGRRRGQNMSANSRLGHSLSTAIRLPRSAHGPDRTATRSP